MRRPWMAARRARMSAIRELPHIDTVTQCSCAGHGVRFREVARVTTQAPDPTLSVIARAAGVSVPTVSKVINGREDVAPQTRRRVERALSHLGYVRRRRSPAGSPSKLVDVVLHDLDEASSAIVLRAAEDIAHAAGLEVIVSVPRGKGSRLQSGSLDRLKTRGSAGVLFNLVKLSEAQHQWLDRQRIPYVLLNPATVPPAGAAAVTATNRAGAARATEHLIALRHRRIALLTGRGNQLYSVARIEGYRSALAATGIEMISEYVRYLDDDPGQARREIRRMLSLQEPPSAVLVCSDSMAISVTDELRSRGLHVPDSISVVGFGDLPVATLTTPQLTTVRVPFADMATAAMQMLVRMINGETAIGGHIELSTRLIERHSTADCASAADFTGTGHL
jgi:DNA-binding LacI/PurR family transcriptional regulator